MSTAATKIKEVIKELTITEHAAKRLDELNQQLINHNIEWKQMDAQLAKELDDIEKLEKMTVTALFHKVLGSKEEQIEKERQEYLDLNLKFKDLNASIEVIEYEISILKNKVVNKEALTNELEKLKKEREIEILRNNEHQKDQLIAINNDIDQLNRWEVELKEAYSVGENLIEILKKILGLLSKAHEWGQWDIRSSGGMYDAYKRNAIDHAISEANQANSYINRFKSELTDVKYNASLGQLNFKEFNGFSNLFFDNLISDWIIQQKIKNTYHHVDNLKDRVYLIMQSLEKDLKNTIQIIEEKSLQRDQLILS